MRLGSCIRRARQKPGLSRRFGHSDAKVLRLGRGGAAGARKQSLSELHPGHGGARSSSSASPYVASAAHTSSNAARRTWDSMKSKNTRTTC